MDVSEAGREDLFLALREVRRLVAAGRGGGTEDAETHLGYAEEHLTKAAKRVLSRYRHPDGQLTVSALAGHVIAPATIVGLVAYLCRGPLHLAPTLSGVIVALALLATYVAAVPLLKRWEAVYGLRGFAARWTVDATPGSDTTTGSGAIARARREVARLAAARVAPTDLTGPGLLRAADRDAVLWHLRAADTSLCVAYDALLRGPAGRPA
jgi:hypothetical protein